MIECDDYAAPDFDLEYIEDEDMYGCPLCCTHTPADQEDNGTGD